MSIETILTGADKPARSPGRFLARDRWETLTQRAIELSHLLKKPVTVEKLLTALVDLKLPELVKDAVDSHEREAEAKKKRDRE